MWAQVNSPAAFARLFADDPAAVARTREVAERCTFAMSELRYRYPTEQLPLGMTTGRWLEQLTWQGARERFGGAVTDPMHLDVIRMAVAPVVVVHRQHIGSLFFENRGDLGGRHLELGHPVA